MNTSGGIVKSDAGTLTLGSRNLYTGQTQINGGSVILNGGNNTLPVFITGGARKPRLSASMVRQRVRGFQRQQPNLRHAEQQQLRPLCRRWWHGHQHSATPVSFTSISGSAQIFSGGIAGNLNFNKTGNNALTLSNVSTYTGGTKIRENTVSLLDAGAPPNTRR